jgi:hypothetical protein
LYDVRYDGPGAQMTYPRGTQHADVSILREHLKAAHELAKERPLPADQTGPTGLRPDVEALRWFDLPAGCLMGEPAGADQPKVKS